MAKLNSQDSVKQLEIDLPDKKYFTIGEVSDLCAVKSHVLRYWEQVFPQLEPSKRRGRRYYQRKDVELVLEIKTLLHDQGYTIPGAKARLSKPGLAENELQLQDDAQGLLYKKISSIRTQVQEFRNYLQSRY